MANKKTIVVIGGGAAGFFGAIAAAQANPNNHVILLERARQVLAKVRISGGGRCNVTHSCFEPAQLVQNYPRGHKALRGPFSRFQPLNTIEWFESHGVKLKTEADGRMFPVTDSSETIIACLMNAAQENQVDLRTEQSVHAINVLEKGFELRIGTDETLACDAILIATGSSPKIFSIIETLGHTITAPVPSLFTFNVPDSPLLDLAGISVPKAQVKIEGTGLVQTGPLLITHWGFSGPAVLKLSAWGARILHDLDYRAKISINWLPDISQDGLREKLLAFKAVHPARLIASDSPFELSRNLWKKFVAFAGISPELRWATLPKKEMLQLIQTLHNNQYQIQGKSTYKEEFVTCGGVNLEEVDFKTMESRRCPGLFFAGEVLDIDGVTGGFNFQNAWTTSWIAGQAMAG